MVLERRPPLRRPALVDLVPVQGRRSHWDLVLRLVGPPLPDLAPALVLVQAPASEQVPVQGLVQGPALEVALGLELVQASAVVP